MSVQHVIAIAVALGLGLLVGMQRERTSHAVAGIRTFALICLLGAVVGVLGERFGAWLPAAGFLALLGVLSVGNLQARARGTEGVSGVTTEVAALVVFGVGVALAAGYTALGITVGGLVAVLLQWKAPLHGLVERIGQEEFHAVTQLILIALVVLPMLPDRSFGPYDVLNPFRIWLMIALIVGLSLAAYLTYRILGARRGALLGGILGGLISSTATTVSYARQSRAGSEGNAPITALVVLLASTVLNLRVLIEVGVVAPSLLGAFVVPFGLIGLAMLLLCGWLYRRTTGAEPPQPDHRNPAQLGTALSFGIIYAVVLFAVAAAKTHFGENAVYAVAMVSGLTDVDALTLSAAEFVSRGRLGADTAWRVVMTGAMSNLVFKFAAVAWLGTGALARQLAPVFGLVLLGGLALILFCPAVALW